MPSSQVLSNVMQLRLTDLQHNYVVLQATVREVSQGEVIRDLVDAALASAPDLHLEGEESMPKELRSSLPLSVVLASADRKAIKQLAAELKKN